jgi:cob(I)alamin adenosyltransferase
MFAAKNSAGKWTLARVLNRANLDGGGGDDVYWQSEKLARDKD